MMKPVLMVLALATTTPLAAQSTTELVSEGRSLAPTDPKAALALFERAVARDSLDYEALWRAAVALVEIGQDTPDSVKSPARDSSYLQAERLARRAASVHPERVEGHFVLAMALGRVALTKSKKDRVKYAVGIYGEATRALEIDPDHDGAHHIIGLWHAEARRTSGFNRFMAKNLLGGKILGQSSWDKAIEHLETAVRIDPARIFHRLDLARVYVDRKRYRAAREQLERIAALPEREHPDARYRAEAAALLTRIAGKRDEKVVDSVPGA